MPRIEISRSSSRDPAVNLASEEFLLARAAPGSLRLNLYVNDPCVVIGRNQNPWSEASALLPLYRRISGGGAVVHGPGCLCWSFTAHRDEFALEEGLAFVAAAVSRLGSAEHPVGLVPDDRGALWHAGRKLCGSARAFRGGGVLVHGTLLLEADSQAIGDALCGMTLASSRAVPSRRSPVAGLADFLPGLGLEELVGSIRAEALSRWPSLAEVASPAPEELAPLASRHRDWSWTHGETPAFTQEFREGPLRAALHVEKGIVASLETRAGEPAPARALALLGRPFAPTVAAS